MEQELLDQISAVIEKIKAIDEELKKTSVITKSTSKLRLYVDGESFNVVIPEENRDKILSIVTKDFEDEKADLVKELDDLIKGVV